MTASAGKTHVRDKEKAEAWDARVREIRNYTWEELRDTVPLEIAFKVHKFFMHHHMDEVVAVAKVDDTDYPPAGLALRNNTDSYDDIAPGVDDIIMDSPKMQELLRLPESEERAITIRTFRNASAVILISWHLSLQDCPIYPAKVA